MRITDLKLLCEKLEKAGMGHFESAYTCPDGSDDSIEPNYSLDSEQAVVRFGSYIHRTKYPDIYKDHL